MDEPLEEWRRAWREAAALMSDAGLEALRDALEAGDEALVQGVTVLPVPMSWNTDRPVSGACLIGYAFWRGDGLETPEEIEDAFARVGAGVGAAMGEPSALRRLTNAYDAWTREEMTRLLLPEVLLAIEQRRAVAP